MRTLFTLFFVWLITFDAQALMCDNNKTPAENAQREGAEPGTEEFCTRLDDLRRANLKAATARYQEVVSLRPGPAGQTEKRDLNLSGKILFPYGWRLSQLMDEWAIFVNDDVSRLPERIHHIIAVRRSTIHGELKRGALLLSYGIYFGRLKDTIMEDLSGFDVKVRRYEVINPVSNRELNKIADTVEKQFRKNSGHK